jgi:carbamoyltransferase
VTVYHALDNQPENLLEISANDSLGVLYSLITLHLSFDNNSDEYKIIGLAPDGDPSRFRSFFQQAVAGLEDGSVTIASRGASLVLNAGWHDQSLGIIPVASVPL